MIRLLPAFALLASPAFAHAGAHGPAGILHFLTEPDHLALIALGVSVLALGIYKSRQKP